MKDVGENLKHVLEVVAAKQPASKSVSLIAVSKTKSIREISAAYEAGQRDFGENYIQELMEKAMSPELQRICPDIRWHFIGTLQSNKISRLLSIPNLAAIQTIDSPEKLAKVMHRSENLKLPCPKLFLQVNVSKEPSKHGMSDLNDLLKCYEMARNASLDLTGLMCIGESGVPQRDFSRMMELKGEVRCRTAGDWSPLLSMGMSDDYPLAVEMGSDIVRVGSAIFGARAAATDEIKTV